MFQFLANLFRSRKKKPSLLALTIGTFTSGHGRLNDKTHLP